MPNAARVPRIAADVRSVALSQSGIIRLRHFNQNWPTFDINHIAFCPDTGGFLRLD